MLKKENSNLKEKGMSVILIKTEKGKDDRGGGGERCEVNAGESQCNGGKKRNE